MKEYIHSQWTKASRSLAAAKAIVETDPDSRLRGGGIADKELSALLARDLLIPMLHGTTY